VTQLGLHPTTHTCEGFHVSGLSPQMSKFVLTSRCIAITEARIYRHRESRLRPCKCWLPMSLSSLPSRQSMASNSSSDGSSNSPDTLPDSRCESTNTPQHPRKPIPRKGHTKSRRGCYNCKRRRIKCNERRPQCHHCAKAGLLCEYPANIIQTQLCSTSPSPQASVNLRSTPGTFVSFQAEFYSWP
jgi:hypothetical protein